METKIFVHSETKKGEIFIGNFKDKSEIAREYKTLRFGKIAFNSGGAGTDPDKLPAFVSIEEFNAFEDVDSQGA